MPRILTTDNAKEYLSKASSTVYMSNAVEHKTSVPYRPQQNGIAERINSTLVSAARAVLHHSGLPIYHWEDAIRDVSFKYNCTMHMVTKQLPYTLWYGHPPPVKRFFIFGQLGTVPIITDKTKLSKLDPRGFSARYLYPTDENHVMVYNRSTQKHQRVRAIDFRPYHAFKDPAATTTAAFKSFTFHTAPSFISTTTPPPMSQTKARKYPDYQQWAAAHNKELDLIDQNFVIKWVPDNTLPRGVKILPLQMTYVYKRGQNGCIEKYKARCVLRGDKMIPSVHYDPDKTAFYMADKTSVRLLFAIATAYQLHVEHFDIDSAYLHEKFEHSSTVYVKQLPCFDGSYKHPCKSGILVGNLYGGKQAAFTYLSAATRFLVSIGFVQTQADPCLFYRTHNNAVTFLSLAMDDFLAATTTKTVMDNFFSELQSKYKIKRLGPPTNYLGWKLNLYKDGGVPHLTTCCN